MSQEEFQKLVLEKLSILDNLDKGITELKKDMSIVKDKLRIIEEQTKNLTEFKQTIKDTATDLIKKIS